MNKTASKTAALLGILSTTGLMTCGAVAADLGRAKLSTPAAGVSGAAQQSVEERGIIIVGGQPQSVVDQNTATAPAVKKALTPGATQTLNPQPLPPKTGVQNLSPGATQMLNPQPLPPKLTAPGRVQQAQQVQQKVTGKDLFQTSDSAIIIVSGKQMTAGELKREIKADLTRLAGPPTTFSTMSHKSPTERSTKDSIAVEARAGLVSGKTVSIKTMSISEVLNYCKNHPPEIYGIKGRVASGERFTIDGLCFGDTTGSVEIIGQFPGGKLQPSFSEWNDGTIVGVLPSLRGVPDGTVAITVVRAPDHARSPAQQAKFIAARERVEVPAGQWAPNGIVDKTDVSQGSFNLVTGATGTSGAGGGLNAKFNLKVNPQCALDNMEIPTTTGRVNSMSGWEEGPLNEAAVNVNFSPTCTTKTFDYLVGSESTTWCRIAYQLRAWAYCPVGLRP